MDIENRTVESANETKEEVMANLGLSTPEVKVQKSDSTDKAEETIEESETSNTDEDSDEVTEDEGVKDEAKGKKQGGFQKKINKLTGRANAAEQRAAFLESELLKLKGPKESAQVEKAADSKLDEPNIDNFETYNDYVKALTKFEIAVQRENEAKEKQKETALTQAETEAQAFQSKIEEFAKSKEDYHEVISDVDDIQVQHGLLALISNSKDAALLTYELAKNREELERINSLPPREASVELFRFEAKLLSSSEQKTKEVKTTSASRPLKPVGSASKANLNDSPYEKEMTYQEYKVWSAKQKK